MTAYPIQVIVNGEVFEPDGAPVLNWDGVTYAPLRALAEAYGLKVGYDAERNLATVDRPAASGDFSSQWTITEKPVTNYGNEKIFTAVYSGDMDMEAFKVWWKSMDESFIRDNAEQIAAGIQKFSDGYNITVYFSYGTHNLGSAYAFAGGQVSNFDAAGVWIK